jgi:hypothetical protein
MSHEQHRKVPCRSAQLEKRGQIGALFNLAGVFEKSIVRLGLELLSSFCEADFADIQILGYLRQALTAAQWLHSLNLKLSRV